MTDEMPEFPEDVARIARILAERGYTLTTKQAADAWEAHSESYFASWLVLPHNDNDVAKALQPHLNKERSK